jgi:short-subunit dehydrogenase involved in D-alanine esterification of teichoic acids
MPFESKKVLVIGATSGIGLALAEKFVENGSHVIATGRRKERLDEFATKHGTEKVTTYPFDITTLDKIGGFASDITTAHPNLDCIVLNSGIQRSFDFSKPGSIDLDTISLEITTNYLSYIHLVTAFLPHLQSSSSLTRLIFISSGLALVRNNAQGITSINYGVMFLGLYSGGTESLHWECFRLQSN